MLRPTHYAPQCCGSGTNFQGPELHLVSTLHKLSCTASEVLHPPCVALIRLGLKVGICHPFKVVDAFTDAWWWWEPVLQEGVPVDAAEPGVRLQGLQACEQKQQYGRVGSPYRTPVYVVPIVAMTHV